MANTAHQAPESLDPRVRRTRRRLQGALEQLLHCRSFEKISVADIADAATLNRATFYDHYPDKFTLLEGLVRSRFEHLLSERGVFFSGQCASALSGIALATCDYLALIPGTACAAHGHMDGTLESAVLAVLRSMILEGLRQHPAPSRLSPEIVAASIGGAIYAGAREWVRTPARLPAEEVANSIAGLVAPMLSVR